MPAAGGNGRWRGQGFGLLVEAAAPVPGLVTAPTAAGLRRTTWSQEGPEAADESWPRDAERVLDYRFTDGRAMLLVDHHPAHGYRIWAPGFGRHLVSPGGDAVRSALPRRSGRRWQRLFFAQVLPLAAALRGLDLFHASAVAHAGRALAFVAPSGTGKTSIAAHLVAAGFDLVTDDVLALDVDGAGVEAHPGAAFVGLDAAELRKMTPEGRRRLGPRVARGEKVYVATAPAATRLPLAAVCFLHRSPARAVAVLREEAPDARELLASSFLPYVRSPERLLTHLDVCARIARDVPVYRIGVPRGDAQPAAAALAPRLRALAAESEDGR